MSPIGQASGDGRRRPLVTIRKEYRNRVQPNWTEPALSKVVISVPRYTQEKRFPRLFPLNSCKISFPETLEMLW